MTRRDLEDDPLEDEEPPEQLDRVRQIIAETRAKLQGKSA
jgi:hypothetical protein